MSDFRLSRLIDAAYCTVNTFRHLLTEKAARGHLECIARSLRVGGIYVLGLHLLPSHLHQDDTTRRWTQQRRRGKVTVTLRVVYATVSAAGSRTVVCACWCATGLKKFACGTNFSCAHTRHRNFVGCSLRFHRWNCATSTISGTIFSIHPS